MLSHRRKEECSMPILAFRRATTVLVGVPLALAVALMLSREAPGDVFVYQAHTPKAGDFYIVNNTSATVTFSNDGIPLRNNFNSLVIQPWGVAASPNVDVTKAVGPNGQGMTFHIQAQGSVAAITFGMDTGYANDSNTVWSIRGNDPQKPVLSPSGAFWYTNGQWAEQITFDNYVVTLVSGTGVDDPSNATGWKILLIISRGSPSRVLYQNAVVFPVP